MFRNRLAKVEKHFKKIARKKDISCYRIYDHDLPEFPFIIEHYIDRLYVSEYKRKHNMDEEEHAYWLQACLTAISETLEISNENIFTKLRSRKAGHEGQYQKTADTKNEFVIEENGLKFIVNLSDYLDTGLFLDHRITRKMVMDEANGKKILNLFAYTGSFSVYSAAGGAKNVTTVDLSNTYLAWARRNMQLNSFDDEKKYDFIATDVVDFLESEHATFDLIIMDPPTFSNSKKMSGILDIQKDHTRLINNCLRILTAGGHLYFSTNYTKFQLSKEALLASSIKDITKSTTPFDFEKKLNRSCFLIKK